MCKRFRDVLREPSAVWEVPGRRRGSRRCHAASPCLAKPPLPHALPFSSLSSSCCVDCGPAHLPAGPAHLPATHLPLLSSCPHHAATQTLHVDFIQKDQALLFPELFDESGTEPLTWGLDGTCRRLLHTAVERWTAPRAAAVKRLVLS